MHSQQRMTFIYGITAVACFVIAIAMVVIIPMHSGGKCDPTSALPWVSCQQ